MNKSELIAALASRADLPRSQAAKVIDALFDVDAGLISQALRNGEKIQITGFGSFETKHRAARTGRNPRTGKEVRIPPGRTIRYKPGKDLQNIG